jgi:hypothetical protein
VELSEIFETNFKRVVKECEIQAKTEAEKEVRSDVSKWEKRVGRGRGDARRERGREERKGGKRSEDAFFISSTKNLHEFSMKFQ